MTRFTIFLALSLCCLTLTAQTDGALANPIAGLTTATIDTTGMAGTVVFRPIPAFPQAAGSFNAFMADHLKYPEVAINYAIEGTVVLYVEVTAAGKVNYLHTARTLFAPLDEAAIAVLEKMPAFLPAVRKGKTVRHEMVIPIRFHLR